MPDLKCSCGFSIHIVDSDCVNNKACKGESKRCPCGQMMEVVGKSKSKKQLKGVVR
jgi:hypothetical protein